MATKKKKQIKTLTYQETLDSIESAIGSTSLLLSDAQKNGDKIAMWALTFIYDDLIKSYHRLGNIRLTIKGDQK